MPYKKSYKSRRKNAKSYNRQQKLSVRTVVKIAKKVATKAINQEAEKYFVQEKFGQNLGPTTDIGGHFITRTGMYKQSNGANNNPNLWGPKVLTIRGMSLIANHIKFQTNVGVRVGANIKVTGIRLKGLVYFPFRCEQTQVELCIFKCNMHNDEPQYETADLLSYMPKRVREADEEKSVGPEATIKQSRIIYRKVITYNPSGYDYEGGKSRYAPKFVPIDKFIKQNQTITYNDAIESDTVDLLQGRIVKWRYLVSMKSTTADPDSGIPADIPEATKTIPQFIGNVTYYYTDI